MSEHHSQPKDDAASLAWLKWLVMGLTIVMIAGFLTIVGLIVMTYLNQAAPFAAPEQVTVPAGETVRAFTASDDWSAVVTTDDAGQDRIHILDPNSGEIRQTIEIR